MTALPARSAHFVIAAAVPLRIALALGTDLSPDEAYYLCAARRPELTALVDHPPLLPLVLRASDRLAPWLPVELRVRCWPLVLGTLLAVALVALVRHEAAAGAPPARSTDATTLAALIGAWSLLPLTGGFVATPDGPALLAVALLLLWAQPRPEATLGRALVVGGAAALGCLAKVVVLPAALVVAALAPGRRPRERLAVALPALATLPWLWPSLRFQMHHAFDPNPAPWRLQLAVGAVAAAAVAQALLWPPWLLVAGGPGRRDDGSVDRVGTALVVGLGVSLLGSALLRALPPEPNWFAPAALVLVARGCSRLSPRAARAAAVFAAVPALVASVHVLHPFLPLPLASDPTARLHGWAARGAANPAAAAPGVGTYGVAAELCVYRSACDDIERHFERMQAHFGSSFERSAPR